MIKDSRPETGVMTTRTVYICNTDEETSAQAGRAADVGVWLRNGRAYAGGPQMFLDSFKRAIPGSIVLAYRNGIGVVAVGVIDDPVRWVINPDAFEYYVGWDPAHPDMPEYGLDVTWQRDLRSDPIALSELAQRCGYGAGWAPRGALARLLPDDPERRSQLIEWLQGDDAGFALAEELPADRPRYPEGSSTTIEVNAYERSALGRRACIDHWGTACSVCDVDLTQVYGAIADGFIHVHHLKSIAAIGKAYALDPVNDLRPVCPNCHAMLHLGRSTEPRSIDELRALIRARRGGRADKSMAQPTQAAD